MEYLQKNTGVNDLIITESYKVLKCDGLTKYTAGWGTDATPANWCQTQTGAGDVAMVAGVASFTNFTATR